MKNFYAFTLALIAVSVSADSIFVTTRINLPKPDSTLETEFQQSLAAELVGHGFSATVKGDLIAEKADSNNRRTAASLNGARQAGAAYAMVATLRNFNEESRNFSGYGTESENRIYRCDFTYRLLRTSDGESLKGGTGSVSKIRRTAEGSSSSQTNVRGDLVSLASAQIAKEVSAAIGPQQLEGVPLGTPVEFGITPRGIGMTIPEVVEMEDGRLYVTGERQDVILEAVTVVLDGVVIGSAPSELSALPGLHELTLQREGFEDWSRTVNIRPNLDLVVRMKADEEAIEEFRSQSEFLEGLSANRTLTDAEAERIRGIARMYEQSGYRLDFKVDTDEPIKIEQNNRTLLGDNPDN